MFIQIGFSLKWSEINAKASLLTIIHLIYCVFGVVYGEYVFSVYQRVRDRSRYITSATCLFCHSFEVDAQVAALVFSSLCCRLVVARSCTTMAGFLVIHLPPFIRYFIVCEVWIQVLIFLTLQFDFSCIYFSLCMKIYFFEEYQHI